MTTTDQPDTTPAPAPEKPASAQPPAPATTQNVKTRKKKKTAEERTEEIAQLRAELEILKTQLLNQQPGDTNGNGPKLGRKRTALQIQKGEETLTDPQRAFLEAYREMGIIRRACEVVAVSRQTHYDWLNRSPAYSLAFQAAGDDAVEGIEAEVYRRAVKGVLKPVGWYKGKAGGKVREFSDLLLMFTLKALRPEKYRERVEIRGIYAHVDINRLSDEQLSRVSDGEELRYVIATSQPALLPASSDTDRTESKPERQGTGESER